MEFLLEIWVWGNYLKEQLICKSNSLSNINIDNFFISFYFVLAPKEEPGS